MADELRWEQLAVFVADGTTSEDAGATFRNTTDQNMFIRKIRSVIAITNGTPGDNAQLTLSKARTIVAGNNEPGLNIQYDASVPGTGATPVDGATSDSELQQYAKGEIMLEPNEALFTNVFKSSGGNFSAVFGLGYHF